jgi:hypothetical protein
MAGHSTSGPHFGSLIQQAKREGIIPQGTSRSEINNSPELTDRVLALGKKRGGNKNRKKTN